MIREEEEVESWSVPGGMTLQAPPHWGKQGQALLGADYVSILGRVQAADPSHLLAQVCLPTPGELLLEPSVSCLGQVCGAHPGGLA